MFLKAIFDGFKEAIDNIDPYQGVDPDDTKSLAELERECLRQDSDLGAEMEYIMENETDPLIKKKLEWRLGSGIYEWRDLYDGKK